MRQKYSAIKMNECFLNRMNFNLMEINASFVCSIHDEFTSSGKRQKTE